MSGTTEPAAPGVAVTPAAAPVITLPAATFAQLLKQAGVDLETDAKTAAKTVTSASSIWAGVKAVPGALYTFAKEIGPVLTFLMAAVALVLAIGITHF